MESGQSSENSIDWNKGTIENLGYEGKVGNKGYNYNSLAILKGNKLLTKYEQE